MAAHAALPAGHQLAGHSRRPTKRTRDRRRRNPRCEVRHTCCIRGGVSLLRNRARVVAGSRTDRITRVGQGPCSAREWPASPLFLHVAEHHFGTRPRDGTGTLVPHHPHSTSCPGSRCAGMGMGFLDVSPCMADSPPPSSGFIVTTICGARCTGCVADLVVRVTPSDDQRGGQGQRRRRRSRAVGLGSEARRESSADARGIRNGVAEQSDPRAGGAQASAALAPPVCSATALRCPLASTDRCSRS